MDRSWQAIYMTNDAVYSLVSQRGLDMPSEDGTEARRPFVLIAEEDEDLWLVIESALKDNGFGGESYCVHDSAELKKYLDRFERGEESFFPDLILINFGIAEKGGVLLEIKAKPRFSSIPIVILVSAATWACSFVTKPSSYGEWVATMRQILDRHLPSWKEATL
jgi:DNA-binding response OmpR family regulator